MACGIGLAAARPVRRRQSAGLLVCEDARRRDDPRPRDEVDRRGARDRRRHSRARCAKGSSPPACACRGTAAASSSRSPTRRRRSRCRCCAATPISATRWSRRRGRTRCSRRPASRRERINKIADGSPHVLDLIAARARRSRHQRCQRRARNLRQLQDSPRGGRSGYCVFDQFGYGSGSRGGARQHAGSAAQPARVPQQRAGDDRSRRARPRDEPRVFVLGGNASTLAVVNSFRTAGRHHHGAARSARLDADRASSSATRGKTWGSRWPVSSIGSIARFRPRTSARSSHRCATSSCSRASGGRLRLPEARRRRTCSTSKTCPKRSPTRWRIRPQRSCNARPAGGSACATSSFGKRSQLCAWDYHAQVFGRRGPWRTGLRGAPLRNAAQRRVRCAAAAARAGCRNRPDRQRGRRRTARARRSTCCLAADPQRPHLAVRTDGGFTVLRGNLRNRSPDDQPRDPRACRCCSFCCLQCWRCGRSTCRSSPPDRSPREPGNPRHALLDAHRGRILATDGTRAGRDARGAARRYPMGAALAQTVGYVSTRYGTSGIEDAFDRALTPPDTAGDPAAQLRAIRGRAARRIGDFPRRRRRHDDRPARAAATVRSRCRKYPRARRRRAGSAQRGGPRDCKRAELRSQRLRCASLRR